MPLALSRKAGEEVVIGTAGRPVRVRVMEIGGGRVKLSFDAPPEVRVLRSELLPPEGEGRTQK